MQKIGMLSAFAEMKETDDATFVHPEEHIGMAREIKMRILAEQPTLLYLIPVKWDYQEKKVIEHYDDDDFIQFLAYVPPGMERLEFMWDGSFCIRVKGGSIWLDTFDNSSAFSIESLEPESFARVWERPERDPRILEMEQAARHNENRLREQIALDRAERDELRRMLQNVIASQTAGNTQSPSAQSDDGRQLPSGAPSGDSSVNQPVESGTGGVS